MKHPRLLRFKPRRRATRDTSKLPALRALSLATCNSSLAPCTLPLAACNSSLEPCALQLETVSYDEHLLERSCTQWQFGDWQSLAKISRQILQHHPDRGKLALFTAAGLLQTDEHDQAKEFVRLALDWGMTKKQVCQILVAGVHNSLGRAAALGGQEERAYQHFERAVAVNSFGGGDSRLLAEARAGRQLQQISAPVHPTEGEPVAIDFTSEHQILNVLYEKFGCEYLVSSKTQIKKGLANKGIYLYTAKKKYSSFEKAPKTIQVIEKIITDKYNNEADFYRITMQKAWGRKEGLPEVFNITSHKNCTSIFMEYIPNVGCLVNNSNGVNLDKLTNAIVDSVLFINNVKKTNNAKSLPKYYFQKISESSEFQYLRNNFQLDIVDFEWLDDAVKDIKKYPIVYSHNDLKFENMAFKENDNSHYNLLDFGLIGFNIAGAEFHNFLRNSVDDYFQEKLFHRLIDVYAQKGKFKKNNLYISCAYYALVRLMWRVKYEHEHKKYQDVKKYINNLYSLLKISKQYCSICA